MRPFTSFSIAFFCKVGVIMIVYSLVSHFLSIEEFNLLDERNLVHYRLKSLIKRLLAGVDILY